MAQPQRSQERAAVQEKFDFWSSRRVRRYASPYLWNQLSSLFRQPHSVHCPPGLPRPAHITSSQSPPSLLPSVTPSTFHSRLKTHLFHKSFSPQSILFLSWLPSRILTCTELKVQWRLFVSVSFFYIFSAIRVLDKAEYSAFESTLNSSIVSYRMISYRIGSRFTAAVLSNFRQI